MATNDLTKTAVKNLIKADLAVYEATSKLAIANEQLAQAQDVVRQLLPRGAHRFGKWVVNIYDKIHKGRRAPKWKSIAEHLAKTCEDVQATLLLKYQALFHPAILEYGQATRTAFVTGQELYTSEPEQTLEVVVELTKAIDGGPDAQA